MRRVVYPLAVVAVALLLTSIGCGPSQADLAKARVDGSFAYNDGFPASANPYVDEKLRSAWMRGYGSSKFAVENTYIPLEDK